MDSRLFPAALAAAFLLLSVSAPPARAQESTSTARQPDLQAPAPPRPPAIIDPAGPTISLESSPALFFLASSLNACGYDAGLEDSSPLRAAVRREMQAALSRSEEARGARDSLCSYIEHHRLSSGSRDLAQYVSLSLYTTPPPDLLPSADLTQMPPDATQVVEVLPLVRSFARAVNLGGIWLEERHGYDLAIAADHDVLSRMIVDTNVYLKMPANPYDGRRFTVVFEPMLSPGDMNARVYGADYLAVVSPDREGKVPLDPIRHAYLHYMIEPLIYARSGAIDRMQPIMKEVRDAPLDFVFRSDVDALVVECLIKAIEARTMDTGVPRFEMPAHVERAQLEEVERRRSAYQQKVDGIRQARVRHDMEQGYVLTQYFYDRLPAFERDPASMKESIGELVYGMDVQDQVHKIRRIEFAGQAEPDIVRRSAPRLGLLDTAELRLLKGDTQGAAEMARKALADKTPDPARANFLLARADIESGNVERAVAEFEETLRVGQDPRLLAWSHIYLGRLYDLEAAQDRDNDELDDAREHRDRAVAEYRQALTVRDGQQDTRMAAERGIREPYAIPGHPVPPAGSGSQASRP